MRALEIPSFKKSHLLQSISITVALTGAAYGINALTSFALMQHILKTRAGCTSVLETPIHSTLQWSGKMPSDHRSQASFYQIKASNPNGGTSICEAINDENGNPVALNFCAHHLTDVSAPQRCDSDSASHTLDPIFSDIYKNIVQVVSSESP